MRTLRAKVCEQGGTILRQKDGGTRTEVVADHFDLGLHPARSLQKRVRCAQVGDDEINADDQAPSECLCSDHDQPIPWRALRHARGID